MTSKSLKNYNYELFQAKLYFNKLNIHRKMFQDHTYQEVTLIELSC
jgi:hypothetical protein